MQDTDLEVIETRALGFFSGLSRGPVLASYQYQSHAGARVDHLRLIDQVGEQTQKSFSCYYNGGGYFVDAQKYPHTTMLAYYIQPDEADEQAAIIEIKVGKGLAILPGPHCEYEATLLDKKNLYLNQLTLYWSF